MEKSYLLQVRIGLVAADCNTHTAACTSFFLEQPTACTAYKQSHGDCTNNSVFLIAS